MAYIGRGKRIKTHRISSPQYAKTSKLIAIKSVLQSGGCIAAKDFLDIPKQDLQTLAEYAPILDDIVIEKNKRLGKYPPKKSNATNLLTSVYIDHAEHVPNHAIYGGQ